MGMWISFASTKSRSRYADFPPPLMADDDEVRVPARRSLCIRHDVDRQHDLHGHHREPGHDQQRTGGPCDLEPFAAEVLLRRPVLAIAEAPERDQHESGDDREDPAAHPEHGVEQPVDLRGLGRGRCEHRERPRTLGERGHGTAGDDASAAARRRDGGATERERAAGVVRRPALRSRCPPTWGGSGGSATAESSRSRAFSGIRCGIPGRCPAASRRTTPSRGGWVAGSHRRPAWARPDAPACSASAPSRPGCRASDGSS